MSDIDLEEDSSPMPLDDDRSFVKTNDFLRLEGKVDRLVKALNRLIIFEERQTRQTEEQKAFLVRIATIEKAMEELDKKMERWINRGMGVWAIVGILWVLLNFLSSNGITLTHVTK